MKKSKGSEFIYAVHLEHETGEYGLYNFRTFYDRREALDFVESMARNNPDICLNVDVRPRIRKRNVLTAS